MNQYYENYLMLLGPLATGLPSNVLNDIDRIKTVDEWVKLGYPVKKIKQYEYKKFRINNFALFFQVMLRPNTNELNAIKNGKKSIRSKIIRDKYISMGFTVEDFEFEE